MLERLPSGMPKAPYRMELGRNLCQKPHKHHDTTVRCLRWIENAPYQEKRMSFAT